MADPIVIQVRLGTDEINRAGQEIARKLTNALNTGATGAREAGRKIAESFDAGLRDVLTRAQLIGRQINAALSPNQRHRTSEAAEVKHQQRLAEIQTRAALQQANIQARADAQIVIARARREAAELRHQQRLIEIQERAANRSSALSNAGAVFGGVLGGLSVAGLASALENVARTAFNSAAELDKNRQTLIALTGSADAANKKLAELRSLAARTPGLTASLANEAFTLLKASANIADDTINRVLQSVGRLNAVFTIDDPKGFIRNLLQIFSQGFERADIKEALGRVPIFEQILEQAFGTRDAGKLRQLKESGKLTLEGFLSGISDAIQNNPVLGSVRESIGSQFAKLKDEALISLAPLGEEIAAILLPLLKDIGPALAGSARTVADELRKSRDEFEDVRISAGLFLDKIVEIGKSSGFTFDLQAELRDLRDLVDFLTLSIASIQDIIEIAGAAILGAIKAITLAAEVAINTVIEKLTFGFFSPLEADIKRLKGDLDFLTGRIDRGFENLRSADEAQQQARRRARERAEAEAFAGTRQGQQSLARLEGVDTGAVKATTTSPPAAPSAPTGGGASRAISDARALRDAQLRADQDFLRNQFDLLKDANERTLREEEDSFKLRLLDADQFYKDKLGLLQANIGNEINLLNEQLIAVQEAFNKSKPNTAERVRLGQQVNELQTQITLKTRALGDVEKQVFSESIRARNDVIDLSKQQVEVIEDEDRAMKALAKSQRERITLEQDITAEAKRRLEDQGRVLDGQLVATGANLDLKVLNAQKAAILEIRQADEDAILSMIQNRERLADASIFHADRANAIFLDHLARQQSVTEAVGDAMIKVYEGVAGSLDKGIDRLTKKLGVFGDVLNGILKSIVRGILSNLFAPTFGGGQQAGGGGLLGSILGGVFGGQAGGGLLGNIFGGIGGGFRTPGFNPAASGGGFNFGSLFGLAAGGGISAPPSVSLPFLPNLPVPLIGPAAQGQVKFGGGLGAILGNLGGLFKGFGFGLKPGSALGGLASAAPLLGLSLGAGLGTDTLTKILGGAGGALLGIGLTAAPAIFGAGGALASPALAALFSNPITAIVGGALLVGAFFLGRARQRKRDEQASGDFLTDAITQIRQLRDQVGTDQIDGGQARSIFENQILGTFIQQINTLKTKSVRESRLTNQVRDLRNLFEKEVGPEIEAQKRRRITSGKLVPEFATGGIVPGLDFGRDSVLSLLRPREMVLTLEQQATIARIAGGDVFARAGVPGVQQQSAFAAGGIVPLASASQPVVIEVDEISVSIGEDDASKILFIGARTNLGRSVIVRANKEARLNREGGL